MNTSLESVLPNLTDDSQLIELIIKLTESCKTIAEKVNQGPLAGIYGSAEAENVQGETQKKLDIISNDILKDDLAELATVKGLASEEEDEVVAIHGDGRFLVSFDPLDGSSNIDINSLVGTIFSVQQTTDCDDLEQDFLQPGKNQIAAGYVLYGPASVLCLTVGKGTQMFVLNPEDQTFIQIEEQVQIAEDTKEFAINMSNQRHWAAPVQDYISELLKGQEGSREKNFNMRWVAAMVADVHRILSRGGVFLYPWDKREPNKPGKLRLLYEANPIGLLVEQAGGMVITDTGDNILDIEPEQLHQRVPVVLGSKNEIAYFKDLVS